MKRVLLFGASFVFMACTVTSCESLGDCKTCKQVYYLNNAVDHEGSEAEYCGAELTSIEKLGTITVGEYKAKWECR